MCYDENIPLYKEKTMGQTRTIHHTKSFYDTEANYIFRSGRHSGIYTPKHRHTFYELVYAVDGVCEHLYEETTHCIARVDTHFDYLIISVAESEFCKFLQLYGDALLSSLPREKILVRLSPDAQKVIRCLLESLPSSRDGQPPDHTVRAICSALFSFYIDQLPTAKRKDRDMLTAMMEKMSIDLSLQREGTSAMIRLSGYSMAQLTRLMKSHYGVTPHECLKAFRMRSAYRLVAESTLPLESVSYECGYRCYGYFTTQFKQVFGKTPAACRREKSASHLL